MSSTFLPMGEVCPAVGCSQYQSTCLRRIVQQFGRRNRATHGVGSTEPPPGDHPQPSTLNDVPLYSFEGKTPSIHPTARVMGPIEGTSAESWVTGSPGAHQDLAQRDLTGFAEA